MRKTKKTTVEAEIVAEEPSAILESKRLYNRLVEQLTPDTVQSSREF